MPTGEHDPVTGAGPATGSGHACCSDFAVSRRSVLTSALALGGALTATRLFGETVLQASYAGTAGAGGNVLVVLSMRGGIDGIGTVVPHADPAYYRARPSTSIPASALLQADASFGLHPSLAPLERFWTGGTLAAVHAVGLPSPNRSHFEAIEEVEDAAPGSSVRSGWLNRMVGLGAAGDSLGGVQLGTNVPSYAIAGTAPTLTASTLKDLQVSGLGGSATADRYASLKRAWEVSPSGRLLAAVQEAITVSEGAGAELAAADTSTTYPTDGGAKELSTALANAAALIKADVGTDAIAVDFGSFDLHAGYGGVGGGLMNTQLAAFAGPLAAFLDDLGAARSRVTVLTISEFGRRLLQNGNGGFDHGWGNVMFVAGAGVKGGQYYGRWPGLDPLVREDSDLTVTTDYRDVLAEVVAKRFPDRSMATLFPGFSPAPLGFMA